jgi:hypothetical protein
VSALCTKPVILSRQRPAGIKYLVNHVKASWRLRSARSWSGRHKWLNIVAYQPFHWVRDEANTLTLYFSCLAQVASARSQSIAKTNSASRFSLYHPRKPQPRSQVAGEPLRPLPDVRSHYGGLWPVPEVFSPFFSGCIAHCPFAKSFWFKLTNPSRWFFTRQKWQDLWKSFRGLFNIDWSISYLTLEIGLR